MKKPYLFLALLALVACKKSTPSPYTTVVEYKFTAQTSSSYLVTYTDRNNHLIDTNYVGISFDKVITTNAATGFKAATFTVLNTAKPVPTLTVYMNIIVNNVAAPWELQLTPSGSDNYTYHVVVFK
ncbi:MAG: hypothetical protein ACXVJE_19470 [Mucilaginibacter sp.]